MDDVRAKLDQLIRDRGDGCAGVSRMLGRNPAYIQQFIRRGTPRKLDEEDRRTLARYFGVSDTYLGGPQEFAERQIRQRGGPLATATAMAMVPRLQIGASAGPGALVESESKKSAMGFDERWLRSLGVKPDGLSIIQVRGDSMVPTLADGDDILVSREDGVGRARDGIYVLRVDDTLMVKRLSVNPATRALTVRSDNPIYPDWEDCDPSTITVIGRVVWIGRRLP